MNSRVVCLVFSPHQFECWTKISNGTSRRALRIEICGSWVVAMAHFQIYQVKQLAVLQKKKMKKKYKIRKRKWICTGKKKYMKLKKSIRSLASFLLEVLAETLLKSKRLSTICCTRMSSQGRLLFYVITNGTIEPTTPQLRLWKISSFIVELPLCLLKDI